MKDYYDAVKHFWSGFLDRRSEPAAPIPAFLTQFTEAVPDNSAQSVKTCPPSPPYITFHSPRPRFADFALLTAIVWTRSASVSLLHDILDQIENAIPEGGTRISLDLRGSVMLYRANPFIDYIEDNKDTLVKGGIIRVSARNYIT